MQESVGSIVLLSREPLGLLLYACNKEEGGVMLRHLDSDLRLYRIRVLPNDLPEICFLKPARGRGAVHHQEGTVAAFQTASQHVNPL